MAKTRILILIGLVLVIFAFAIFLWGGTESRLGDFIFSNPVTPALLFFVFFAAFAGVLKIFIDAMVPTRMSKTESTAWERIRAKGKLSYVLNALLVSSLPIMVMLAIEVAYSELTSYIVRNFVVLGLVLTGGVAAIASSLWNYREAMYLKAREDESSMMEGLADRD